jgi:tRNA 2-thiouridine synthesizing protein E
MESIEFNGKTYDVDSEGFLIDANQWSEDFANGLAHDLGIPDGLSGKHWEIIKYIRKSIAAKGKCPLVYETCRMNGLPLREFRILFPTGYLRGACKLAGITYKEAYIAQTWLLSSTEDPAPLPSGKTYRVDARGFLVDPEEWDEVFALHKAYELKMPEKLTAMHFQIIRYLRESYLKTGSVPTIYNTCEANHIEIEELERLFPDGYHRGAVKIAGLRVR